MPESAGWIDAGPAEPEERDEIRALRAGDAYIALAHVHDAWRAFADSCTHHECPLSDGWLVGPTIECPCHGSIFDVRTGEVLRGPATEPIARYPIELRDGRIVVDVNAPSPA